MELGNEVMVAMVVSSYKESRNNKPMYMYGYMLPNLSPSPKVQSVYNNNVAP